MDGTAVMIRWFMIYCAVLALWMAGTRAMPVTAVAFSGHTAVATDDLEQMLGITPGAEYIGRTAPAGIKRILAYYGELGYYDARIERAADIAPDSSGAVLRYIVTEGPRYMLGEAVINGNRRFPASELADDLELVPGAPVPAAGFDENIDRLLVKYGNAGYPFAAVEVAEYGLKDSTVWMVLDIREGRPAVVNGFSISGNKVTREKVILRELGIAIGTQFNREAVLRAETRLRRLRLFSRVDPISMDADDTGGKVVLHITVHEDAMNDFNGVVGYIPAENAETEGYVTGRLDILLRNVSGSGRLVHAMWEKPERNSSNLAFKYEEPWVLGYPVTAGGEFSQQNRELEGVFRYTGIEAGLYVRMPISENLTGELGGSRNELIPVNDTTLTGNPEKRLSYNVDVSFEYDTRNEPANPAYGAYYATGGEYVFRQGHEDNQTYELTLQHHFPVLKRQTVSLGLEVNYLQTKDAVPQYGELFELGGVNSLRGYRESSFFGTRTGRVFTEYKYFLDRNASVYLFGDCGYYYRPMDAAVREDVKFGYGFGGIFLTRLGALKMEYGLGEGDGVGDGKIHVRWHKSF